MKGIINRHNGAYYGYDAEGERALKLTQTLYASPLITINDEGYTKHYQNPIHPDEPIFYYHSDHLGSASFLTDNNGNETQQLVYLPYGEDWVDLKYNTQQFETPYKFNGKEKDLESGYNYYGARYYYDWLSIWLSVDPLSDKYPHLTSYNYCANNPVMLVDPDGREWVNAYDAVIANGQGNMSNRQWRHLLKQKQQVDNYINNIKANDRHLYNYIDNLKVTNKKNEIVNVKVTVEFAKQNANETARTEYSNSKNQPALYNGKGIIAPLDKDGNIGFNIFLCKKFSFSDESLSNEIGDVMFRMEYFEQSIKSGSDAFKSDEQYRKKGDAGDYSSRVEAKYIERKKIQDKSKLTNIYPLSYEE